MAKAIPLPTLVEREQAAMIDELSEGLAQNRAILTLLNFAPSYRRRAKIA
ncbi:MAG: hypothetical protein WB766_20945 [Roseiarcus sp.]